MLAVLSQTGWLEVAKCVLAPTLLPALCSVTVLSDYFLDSFCLECGSASVAVRQPFLGSLIFPGELWGGEERAKLNKIFKAKKTKNQPRTLTDLE